MSDNKKDKRGDRQEEIINPSDVPNCPMCGLGENESQEKYYYCPYCLYCVKHRKFPFSKKGGHYLFEFVFDRFIKEAYLPNVGKRKATIKETPTIEQLEDFEKFYLKIYRYYKKKYTREEFNWFILENEREIAFKSIGQELFNPINIKVREQIKEMRKKHMIKEKQKKRWKKKKLY